MEPSATVTFGRGIDQLYYRPPSMRGLEWLCASPGKSCSPGADVQLNFSGIGHLILRLSLETGRIATFEVMSSSEACTGDPQDPCKVMVFM
nr:hypothetical protein CFP56_76455 [Quercus suber]